MEKSEVYKAIIKIKEYCKKQKECEGCEFLDEYDTGMCLLRDNPEDWDTDDIPYNILEEEQEG